tara:strand:- start:3155 stop:3835 length:681 start_codon:yes stop_codon:yes gene_type:complete
MKRSDFNYGSVPGDGACFFHSVALILILEDQKKIKRNENSQETNKKRNKLAKKIRRDCIHWLKQNLDYTIPQLGRTIGEEIQDEVDDCIQRYTINPNDCRANYKTIKEYLTYMKKPKSWAGQIEIYALSYNLGRSIRVFTDKGKGKLKNSGLGFMINSKPDILDDIHLFHNSGTKNSNEYHFDALFPKKKAKLLTEKLPSMKRKKTKRRTKSQKEKTKGRTKRRIK